MYLYKSVKLQYALLVLLTIVYVTLFGFVRPVQNGGSLPNSPAMQFLFLLKIVTLSLIAMQASWGFPTYSNSQYLTRYPSLPRFYACKLHLQSDRLTFESSIVAFVMCIPRGFSPFDFMIFSPLFSFSIRLSLFFFLRFPPYMVFDRIFTHSLSYFRFCPWTFFLPE